ncbi:hypothetical protein EV702DRAFT_1202730 [Suillus placidus]|uniref:Uncharacterized protein n=1 Tax=Suillus placidus TaxID=48579 RepID=A0A9P7CY23_9AGAM|nr:hypothetical protein EV702DRAFT_1202730 [Suillus placidus]
MNDCYTFLEFLTKNETYLELVDATRDLAILAKQKPCSEQHANLPTWANWSWGESYLPEDVHVSYDTLMASLKMLETSPSSGAPSAMPVVLGLGLLHRESNRVIEFVEDKADPNTPFYLPGSAFDLQFLVALDGAVNTVFCNVVTADTAAVVEKEALANNILDQENEKEHEEEEKQYEHEEEKEKQQEEEQEQEEGDKEVEDVVKTGRKRSMPQVSTRRSKKSRTEPELHRSSRARQPSKKALK